MRTFLSSIAAGLVVLALAVPLSAGPRNLIAHANENSVWIARIFQDSSTPGVDQTELMVRQGFGNTDWTDLPQIGARVVSLTDFNGQALLALANGQWMLADADGVRVGGPAPLGGRVLCVASADGVVWAIVRLGDPATQPTTAPDQAAASAATNASSEPSTRNIAPPQLVVCRMDAGNWVDVHPLPFDALAEPDQLAMMVVHQLPLVACKISDHEIRLSQLAVGPHVSAATTSPSENWITPLSIVVSHTIADFQLIQLGGESELWTTPGAVASTTASADEQATTLALRADAGELHHGPGYLRITPLPIDGSAVPSDAAQAVCVAFEHLRWLANSGSHMYQQEYDPHVQPMTKVSDVPGQQPQTIDLIVPLESSIVAVLLAAGVATSQRGGDNATRKPDPPIPPDQLPSRLAAAPARFAAALVDLVPLAGAVIYSQQATSDTHVGGTDVNSLAVLLILALITCVAHTMVAELICGQSIGKIIFGLRVVAANGTPPTRGSIILRNLVKFVDFTLAPLVLMAMTPLRQRLGDLAGGTVVIAVDLPAEEAP